MDNGLSLSPLIVNLIPARLDTCVEPSHQATSLGFIRGPLARTGGITVSASYGKG